MENSLISVSLQLNKKKRSIRARTQNAGRANTMRGKVYQQTAVLPDGWVEKINNGSHMSLRVCVRPVFHSIVKNSVTVCYVRPMFYLIVKTRIALMCVLAAG